MTQRYFKSPWNDQLFFFVEFKGDHLVDVIESLGHKNIIYFEDKETLEEVVGDLRELVEACKGTIRISHGKYLSGLRTIALINYSSGGKTYQVEKDFGYEAQELEILDLLEVGPLARQEARRAILQENGGVLDPAAKISLEGVSFRYLQ